MKKILNKTLIVLMLSLILTGGGCTNNDSNDIELESAKKDFLHLTYNFTEQRKQTTVTSFEQIANVDELSFFDESVSYEKTTYSKFPYTANRKLTLVIENPNPYEFIFADQLFLYDSSRQEWLPISDIISKTYTKDGKVINEIISTSDLWEEDNDWKELYKY